MIVYHFKKLNGHLMFDRPIKLRRSNKNIRYFWSVGIRQKRNENYWWKEVRGV